MSTKLKPKRRTLDDDAQSRSRRSTPLEPFLSFSRGRSSSRRGQRGHWRRHARYPRTKRTLEEAGPVSSRTSDTGGGTHVIEDTRFAKDLSQHHVHVHSACLELVVRKSQARTQHGRENCWRKDFISERRVKTLLEDEVLVKVIKVMHRLVNH